MNRTRWRRAHARHLVLVALAAGAAMCVAPAVAGAALTTFAMTPTSGPPGTVVHVHGSGCAPGLLGSPQTDFVTVTAPTLQVVARVPVGANGDWHGSFRVPANASGAVSAPVSAACVSSGVPSLTTIYAPRAFSVTDSALGDGPPATQPRDGGSGVGAPGPDGTVSLPGDASVIIGVPAGEAPRGSDAGGAGNGGARTHRDKPVHAAVPAAASGPTGGAPGRATLRQAGFGALPSADTGGSSGVLGALLLLALLLAAGGSALAIRRAQHARLAAIADEERR